MKLIKPFVLLVAVAVAIAVFSTTAFGDRSPSHELAQQHQTGLNVLHRDRIQKRRQHSTISGRASSGYADAVCKGTKLLRAMGATIGDAPGEDWAPDDLAKWGFTHKRPEAPFPTTKEQARKWKIRKAFHKLNLDHGGPMYVHRIWHQQPDLKDAEGRRVGPEDQVYLADSKTYRMTGAFNQVTVDHKTGAMYATFMSSPREAAKKTWKLGAGVEPKSEELPQLRMFSDIMWGAWKSDPVSAGSITIIPSVKYYFSIDIQNQETLDVIDLALESVKQYTTEKWPGNTFGMDSEAGKALLGTPNGRVIGYFLAQHKAELGQKTVTKVTAFTSSEYDTVLAFYVDDIPA
ncbi:hypothetical protein K504DRAFT_498213 [Pleomassaria siparia CBS 279.74]|uniref:Uncharacterized protein n=1 Tax=Pleomassaria siparia CBS 279.74 TaxID=1314801 RepID=A0A6G1KKG5_9PLEO|nr:hypothetical protein K504DRAFT_498213 [Pleomassaria siparia CBS 279.74]